MPDPDPDGRHCFNCFWASEDYRDLWCLSRFSYINPNFTCQNWHHNQGRVNLLTGEFREYPQEDDGELD
jgi:hypothetical protein